MFDTRPLSLTPLLLLALAAPVHAQEPDPEDDAPPSHHLAESDTAYVGAVLLEGGAEVTIGDVVPGTIGDANSIRRTARFVGNTLYAEAHDNDGNAVAMVVEIYWFESSVPRGSDFFVAVVKARTIPHLADDWVLDHDPAGPTDRVRPDRGASLVVRAQTDDALATGGFRWDWSIPFRDYGMDAYGTIRMSADYGVGLTSNGSSQTAYQRNDHGVETQVEAQATGHLNSEFAVNTNYEITLHRWDVYTRNSAGMLEWSMFLRTADRERQNAYHEFFVAMQTDEGDEFRIDRLEVAGHVKRKRDFWFDDHRGLSVAVEDIVVRRPDVLPTRPPPASAEPPRWGEDAGPGGGGSDDDDDRFDEDDEGFDWADDEFYEPAPASGGCRVSHGPTPRGAAWLALLALGLLAAGRRRVTRGLLLAAASTVLAVSILGCAGSPAGDDAELEATDPDGDDSGDDDEIAACDDGEHDCDGLCVPDGDDDPETGCRRGCGDPCEAPEGAVATCDEAGGCAFECVPPFVADGGGCACVPRTCEDAGATCGGVDDGCGATLDCGGCGDGQTCEDNGCTCPADAAEPDDAMAAATDLGEMSDRGLSVAVVDDRTLHHDLDEDWYRVTVHDAFDFRNPSMRVELAGIPADAEYDLGAFYVCDSDADEGADCEDGVASDVVGRGCTSTVPGESTEEVRLHASCPGRDESGVLLVRVSASRIGLACEPYLLRVSVE